VKPGYTNDRRCTLSNCMQVPHHYCQSTQLTEQEAQLMLTNPCDAFTGQSRSTNMVPFDTLGMVSYFSMI